MVLVLVWLWVLFIHSRGYGGMVGEWVIVVSCHDIYMDGIVMHTSYTGGLVYNLLLHHMLDVFVDLGLPLASFWCVE